MSDPSDDPLDDDPLDDGPTETDDTTEADAGLTGGTGAAPGEGSTQPYGTVHTPDDDRD